MATKKRRGGVLKKGFAICLAIVATLAMCGCADKEAQVVIDKIGSIGELDTADISVIEESRSLYDALTEDQKAQVNNYEDLEAAESELPALKKAYAIENDKTAPTFDGYKSGETIEAKAGTNFNLNEQLKKKLVVKDDVTEGPIEYRIDCDSDSYDSKTGKLNTQEAEEFPVTVSATDEAGNEGKLNLTIKVVPIHVTKDNPNPVVYDGEYGKVIVDTFEHTTEYGEPAYHVVFDVTNACDKPIEVALASTYTTINDYQVGASYIVNAIPKDTRGKTGCLIDDADIPDDIGSFSTIESKVSFYEQDNEDAFYRIPIVFDVDVLQ